MVAPTGSDSIATTLAEGSRATGTDAGDCGGSAQPGEPTCTASVPSSTAPRFSSGQDDREGEATDAGGAE